MRKSCLLQRSLFISISFLLLLASSCKKESKSAGTSGAKPTKLGFYEYLLSSQRLLIMAVSKVGTQSTNYGLIFDTGSGGMVMDADKIIPASMITNSGFVFNGDSTIVNGITITKKTSTVSYGDDNNTLDTVYGNLAYADVTIGDANGSIIVKHLPFFLYYKATNNNGVKFGSHAFDVFGVSSEYDITFAGGAYVTSPFSYFDPGNGLKRGFKMAALGTSNFTPNGTYVTALTLGLTDADISSFATTTIPYSGGGGYFPSVHGSINANNASFSAEMLFDTGTSPYTYIKDPHVTDTLILKKDSQVSLSTNIGYQYSYTVGASTNLTYLENPTFVNNTISIIGLDFFINNEYMLDFTDHKLGLKNN